MPNPELVNHTRKKLSLIAEKARQEPELRFTSLAHLLNEEFLRECYFKLGRDRASGIDGVSWKEYGECLDENLRELVVRLKAKRYKPQPARRVFIPKGEHDRRPLGLPALEDKIVQGAIAKILAAIYEADFLDCSYGFRPRRGCHQAINAVDKTIMTRPVNHVIEADIKGFFDNVSHDLLIEFLGIRIADPSLLLLIRRFLKAGYVDAGMLVVTKQGTPQGGNLSPMLSNVFLHYVLDVWFEQVVKSHVRGECHLVRYADDFICMVQYADQARRIEEALRKRFAKYGLELHPEKTRSISFGRYEDENARKQGRRPHTFDFLGFTHYCGKSRKGRFMVYRGTSRKKLRTKCKEMNNWLRKIRNFKKVKAWWPILRAKLQGHYQYYGVSGNMPALKRFYGNALRMTLKWLNRRSQRRSFNWAQFREYLERYPLPRPRITCDLYTLAPFSRGPSKSRM